MGSFKRSTPYLQSPIFNMYHSEHEMLRYLKRLENRCVCSRTHTLFPLSDVSWIANLAGTSIRALPFLVRSLVLWIFKELSHTSC